MLNDDLLSLPSSLAYAILKSPHCLARGTKGTLVQGEPEAAEFSLPIPEEHPSLLSPAGRPEEQPRAGFRFQRTSRCRALAAVSGRALAALPGPLPAGRGGAGAGAAP